MGKWIYVKGGGVRRPSFCTKCGAPLDLYYNDKPMYYSHRSDQPRYRAMVACKKSFGLFSKHTKVFGTVVFGTVHGDDFIFESDISGDA